MIKTKLTQHILRLRELRDRKDELEDELKTINKERGKLEDELIPNLMVDQEIESIKIDGAGSVSVKPEIHCYVLVENQEKWVEWLDKHNHSSIIKRTIHHATQKSFVKECLENNIELPKILKVTKFMKASLRRS